MLQIKNLSITHLKDNRVLLNQFNLTINPGDKAAIIGEEGNGKSTLLKLIYDETMIEDYIEYSGEMVGEMEMDRLMELEGFECDDEE